jgi:hypothetical protein
MNFVTVPSGLVLLDICSMSIHAVSPRWKPTVREKCAASSGASLWSKSSQW